MLNPYKSIYEAKQVGIVYHFTNYKNIIDILDDNILMIGNHDYISTTRNKQFKKTNLQVRITLDGTKISNNYKIEPYNYFSNDFVGRGEDEMEERIITRKLENLDKYIKKIDIKYHDSVFKYQMGRISWIDYVEKIEDIKMPRIKIYYQGPIDASKIKL